MTGPPGVAANLRAWAGEIKHLLPPLATGHLRDINADWSGMVFITGTAYRQSVCRRLASWFGASPGRKWRSIPAMKRSVSATPFVRRPVVTFMATRSSPSGRTVVRVRA
jgi:hypothetical protein